ncbi:MAG: hypothetical protein DRN30_06520 [Thermoplasmata archaeon]|nr:MAG: hypothetical protein DRN30_06520 [Thermoplasmata archaeon]
MDNLLNVNENSFKFRGLKVNICGSINTRKQELKSILKNCNKEKYVTRPSEVKKDLVEGLKAFYKKPKELASSWSLKMQRECAWSEIELEGIVLEKKGMKKKIILNERDTYSTLIHSIALERKGIITNDEMVDIVRQFSMLERLISPPDLTVICLESIKTSFKKCDKNELTVVNIPYLKLLNQLFITHGLLLAKMGHSIVFLHEGWEKEHAISVHNLIEDLRMGTWESEQYAPIKLVTELGTEGEAFLKVMAMLDGNRKILEKINDNKGNEEELKKSLEQDYISYLRMLPICSSVYTFHKVLSANYWISSFKQLSEFLTKSHEETQINMVKKFVSDLYDSMSLSLEKNFEKKKENIPKKSKKKTFIKKKKNERKRE